MSARGRDGDIYFKWDLNVRVQGCSRIRRQPLILEIRVKKNQDDILRFENLENRPLFPHSLPNWQVTLEAV